MSNQTAATTEVFIAGLYQDPDLSNCLEGLPEVFVQQAREGYDSFFIDTGLMSRSQFTREDGSCDLLRVVLEDPFFDEDTGKVSVKVRISGVLNPDGSLEPVMTGKTLNRGQSWLKGLRSLPIEFSPDSVEQGVISQSDYDALVRYAEMWEEHEYDYGKGAMYTKTHAGKRLWVVAANNDGIVTFDMTIRLNPSTKEPSIGICNVAWGNCMLIGSTVGAVKQPARSASAPAARKSTITLPPITRGAAKASKKVASGRRR